MILRLAGGVENILALTPVLAEWKRRKGSLVKVETMFPELLRGNPYVDEAAELVGSEEEHMELGLFRWPLLVKSVTVAYAEKVLGDSDMESWRTMMWNSDKEMDEARAERPEGKVVAVHLDKTEVECWALVEDVLRSEGYEVMQVGAIGSLRARRAAIAVSDLFVGMDGPSSSLAYTTDVPAVVVHTWRDPCYFRPFRRGIPFAALSPSERECPVGRICLANNGLTEFGKVYGCRCSVEPKFKCRSLGFDIMVRKALENIMLEA